MGVTVAIGTAIGAGIFSATNEPVTSSLQGKKYAMSSVIPAFRVAKLFYKNTKKPNEYNVHQRFLKRLLQRI